MFVAPPSMSERSRPSIGPPPSDIIDDDDDDMAPQASIPSSSPPQSLPGSTRPSMAPPSPPSSGRYLQTPAVFLFILVTVCTLFCPNR